MCNKYEFVFLLREAACKILNTAVTVRLLHIANTSLRVVNIDLRVIQNKTMRNPL